MIVLFDGIGEQYYPLMEKCVTVVCESMGHMDVEVSVYVCDNDEIKELNCKYRSIDKETDCLSFPQWEFEGLEPVSKPDHILGDVVISLPKAMEQSKEYGHSLEREIAFLTIHSALHLFGYDHEIDQDRAVMRKKEKEILQKLNI